MKTQLPIKVRRKRAMEKLGTLGNFLEGSLYRADRGEAVRYQLTDKVANKSRTLYVPADMAKEVREWTQNWKQAKRLLKELSELSREEVRAGGQDVGPRRTPKAP